MKRILSVLLITSLFAGNIELDGDVNVTGTIQSQTIESLLEQIAQLQEQIAVLQAQLNASQGAENQLETRVYDLSYNSTNETYIDLLSLTGYNLDFAKVSIEQIDNASCDALNYCELILGYSNNYVRSIISGNQVFHLTGHNGAQLYEHMTPHIIFDSNLNNSIWLSTIGHQGWFNSLTADLKISVTAQFPN